MKTSSVWIMWWTARKNFPIKASIKVMAAEQNLAVVKRYYNKVDYHSLPYRPSVAAMDISTNQSPDDMPRSWH